MYIPYFLHGLSLTRGFFFFLNLEYTLILLPFNLKLLLRIALIRELLNTREIEVLACFHVF